MYKWPHTLEAALSFRSVKDLNKRYPNFFNNITVGYECEVSGGDRIENETDINEDEEISNFERDFSYTYQNYLNKLSSGKTPNEILEMFDITPKYGLFTMSVEDKKQLIAQLRQIHYRVVGLPMQNMDPIMEDPSIQGYSGARSEKQSFATSDTRLINVDLAIKQAETNLDLMKQIASKYVFDYLMNGNSVYNRALQSLEDSATLLLLHVNSLKKPEARTNEIYARNWIYAIGENINNYIKAWEEILKILRGEQTNYFFVYDEAKHIIMLNSSKYDSSGLLSPLLEWSEDGKEYFEEEYQSEYQEHYNEGLSEHLSDARDNLNESESSVIDTIHTFVVDDVDPGAEMSQGYHQSDNFKGKVTVVEGDSSISPAGAEVVSPVFTGLTNSFIWLDKVFDMIDEHDLETNASTGLHVNIGTFMDMTGNTTTLGRQLSRAERTSKPIIDVVKLAILSGDHYLLDQFGRLGNTYAHSISSNVRNLVSANFDFKSAQKSGIFDVLVKLNKQLIQGQHERYRTINMQNLLDKGYIEFRIAGGNNYHADDAKVKKAVYRYAQLCAIACDPQAYFKEYMTELYRLFVDSSPVADIQQPKEPRPKTIQEAMNVIRMWSSKYAEEGNGALPYAPKKRITDDIAAGKSAFETDVFDMIAGIDTKLYTKVDANFLYAIRLLMLYSVKDRPDPKQYLRDTWNQYKDTSIKNYLAPKMYRNKPQWLKFIFTGTMSNADMPRG